jgi:PAS domain S-box-containing protein
MSTRETILIVDDRRDNVTLLVEEILRPAGYNASVAHDGEQGLQKALTEHPDLIIMDVNVPKMRGLDVLQQLRDARSKVPVILMSFHGSEQAAVQAFRLGAQDYVIKPYNAEQMTQAIERALTVSRLQHERDQLTEAIAYAHRHSEKRLKELNILSSIGKSVTAQLDEDRLLTRIVEAAVYITGAEEGILFLVDNETGDLYMRAARGLGEKYARGFRLKVNDSLAGQVVRTGKPVMVTGSHQADLVKLKTGYLVKSLLHVPLKTGDTVIGVLSVDHMYEERTFGNHELYLLATLADYAAIALENTLLRTKLEKEQEQPSGPFVAATSEAASQVLQAHRDQIEERLQAGGALLDQLNEQIASLEVWMEGVASQARSLPTLGAPAEADVSTTPVDAQAALRDELSAILDSMVEGVLVIDQTEQIVLTNRTAEALLETSLAGKSVREVCDDPRWIKTYEVVRAASQLQNTAPGSELESAITRLAIGPKMLRASFRLKMTAGGTPTGTVVVLRDITAEREAQRAKDSFVDSVSQELRTPITSIVGYTDLLANESVGPLQRAQHRFLDRIRTNAEQIGAQLNNLVSMTRIDNRQLEIKAEAVDVASAIQEAVNAIRAGVVEREQVLDMVVEPGMPLVDADPDALYHVLVKLLQNAHRCSPDRAHIALRASKVQEGENLYIALSVADQGGGIAPEDSKKVFNRFYRSDNPDVKGLGDPEMSLPIVKVLVEAHGGRIWMDSADGAGNTFTALLPVYHSARPPGSSVADDHKGQTTP